MSYSGPPPTTPPPPQWRPAVAIQPLPPRKLPPVDHAGIDDAHERARRFTWLVAAAAAVVAVAVAVALLARLPA